MAIESQHAELYRGLYGIDFADKIPLPDTLIQLHDRFVTMLRRATRSRPAKESLVMVALQWQTVYPEEHKAFMDHVYRTQNGIEEPASAPTESANWLETWKGVPPGTPVECDWQGSKRQGTFYGPPVSSPDIKDGKVYIKIEGDNSAQFRKITHSDVRVKEPVNA